MASDFSPDSLRLDLEARREDDVLVLEYTLHNDSDVELAVLNRIPGKAKDGKQNLSAENAYIDVEEGDVLSVREAILPVPKGLSVVEKVIPAATRLSPRSSSRETLRFALPVRAHHPYRAAMLRLHADPGSKVEPHIGKTISSISLVVGVVPLSPPARLVPAGPTDVFRVVPPHAAFAGEILVSAKAALEAPIEALDYEVIPRPTEPPEKPPEKP